MTHGIIPPFRKNILKHLLDIDYFATSIKTKHTIITFISLFPIQHTLNLHIGKYSPHCPANIHTTLIFAVSSIFSLYHITATFRAFSKGFLYQYRSFRISDNIRRVHLHQVRLHKKVSFTGTGATNHKNIFISCILRLFRSARHHQSFCLCQKDIIFKHRVHIWLYVLGISP